MLTLLLLLYLTLAPPVDAGADKALAYSLYNSLFGSTPGQLSYNPLVRPVNTTDLSLSVYMTFSLLAIVTVDEKSQTMTTSSDVLLEWKDEFLSWDVNNYGNLSSITVP